jgi:hypothetical protein
MFWQETRLSSCFHDSIMKTCAWVRHKITKFRLSCTIMAIESGDDVLDKLLREYACNCTRSTRQWTLTFSSQKCSSCNYQQALPFRMSLVLLQARNATFFVSFWNISKICVPVVENKTSLPSLQNPCPDLTMICTNPLHIFTSLSFQSHTTHYFVNVYYMAISFELQCRTQAIVQEHECIQKLSTMRQEIIHFTAKIYLNYIPHILSL